MTDLDSVYRERMHLVAFLSAMFPSYINREDPEWPVILIDLPTGQVSWHFNAENDGDLFKLLPVGPEIIWDGHTTEEKYARLDNFTKKLIFAYKPVLSLPLILEGLSND